MHVEHTLTRAVSGRAPEWWLKWKYRCGQRKRTNTHPLVILLPEMSANSDTWRTVTCLCGRLTGNYVAARDKNSIVWERKSRFVLDDTEAAIEARRLWEAENTAGGMWEWKNVSGEFESSTAAQERKFTLFPWRLACGCEYAREPGKEYSRLCAQHKKKSIPQPQPQPSLLPLPARARLALGEEV